MKLPIIAIFLLAICLIAVQQFRNGDQIRRENFSNRLQQEAETLKIISEPATMAATRAAGIVDFSKPVDNADLARLENSLAQFFFGKARFVIADPNFNNMVSTGFTTTEKDLWIRALKHFRLSVVDNNHYTPEEVCLLMIKYFSQHFSILHLPNFLSIFNGKFADQNGMIFFGMLIDEKMRKISKTRQCNQAPGETLPDKIFGHILLFIPENVYASREWLSANKDMLLQDNKDGCCHIGTLEELQLTMHNTGHESAAIDLMAQARMSSSGYFEEVDTGYIFNRLCSETGSGKEVFVLVARRRDADTAFKASAFSVAAILAFFLLLAAVFINNEGNQRFFSPRLAGHFMLLSCVAAAIPIFALGMQVFLQWQNLALRDESVIYSELDAKIRKLDSENSLETGNLLTAINSFQIFCKELPKFIFSEVEKQAQQLLRFEVTQIYTSDLNGKVDVITLSNSLSGTSVADDTTRFLTILIKFVQQSLKFGGSSNQMDIKEGVLIEAAIEALGIDNMYTLALQQNQLLTFKMLHGAVWAMTHFQTGQDGSPERVFLHFIHRSAFQQVLIDQWQKRFKDDTPEVVFSNQNISFLEKRTTIWLEHRPQLAAMLRSLNHNGGQIKTRLKIGENLYYLLGRRLKGFDWSCIAIRKAAADMQKFDQSLVLIALIIACVFAILLLAGHYFNQIFIQPVRRLSQGVYEMAQGNYDLRIDTATTDEIGRMCQSFNHMGASLKEKDFLGRFLSDIAMDAISGKFSERATRVSGTVLFSDIRDFTTITEKHEPEEVVEMLNDYMTAMEEAIESESGTIEKFIGDAIMAVFLPAIGLQNPVIRAAKAAEKMQTALAELNKKRSENGLFAISNGVGIATGQLLMGVMGNEQGRRDFTVTGVTVRSAAIMEKHSRKAQNRKIVLCPHSAETAAAAGIKTIKLKAENAFELA